MSEHFLFLQLKPSPNRHVVKSALYLIVQHFNSIQFKYNSVINNFIFSYTASLQRDWSTFKRNNNLVYLVIDYFGQCNFYPLKRVI